jgi:tRNA A-37 threonylcarbamoyl transferase component Bud32
MGKSNRCQYCGKERPSDAATCPNCKRGQGSAPAVAVVDHFAEIKSALSERYEIIAEIGHGGNATVYQAIQKNLDRKVALKVLLPGLVNDLGYMERFHLEARAIAKLRHPNIVTIFDEGNADGILFMAMEFLEGKDLHQLVKEKGSLQIQEAVEMARCIALALDYAHGYGIVHRDVKSSNIIMTLAGPAVLTDFGIAQSGSTAVHTKSGSLLGTPEFMSPEQSAGKTVDARTDFYSLGVVLYHALSGKYPFQGDSPITTIHKILYEKPVPLGKLVKLPPAIEHAIDRCLEKDPEKRVGNGKELIALLTSAGHARVPAAPEIAAPAPVETPAERAPEPAGDRSARRPATRQGDTSVRRAVPRSAEIHPPRRAAGRRRLSVRVIMIATVICLSVTGYVAWRRLPDAYAANRSEQPVQAALPERRLVPFLIGASKDEAIKLLKREGFEPGNISVVAVPDSTQRGKVDSQRPAHGSLAKPGTTVDLLIGE